MVAGLGHQWLLMNRDGSVVFLVILLLLQLDRLEVVDHGGRQAGGALVVYQDSA